MCRWWASCRAAWSSARCQKGFAITSFFTVGVSAFVSWVVMYFSLRNKDRSELDAELSSILKIGIEHPNFEQTSFTNGWTPDRAKTDKEYAAYDMYATLVFNFLERYFRFYKFKKEECLSRLDSRNWIMTHKTYWKNPINDFENKDSYEKKFVNLVKEVID